MQLFTYETMSENIDLTQYGRTVRRIHC